MRPTLPRSVMNQLLLVTKGQRPAADAREINVRIAVARIGREEFSITFDGFGQPSLLVEGMRPAQYVAVAHCS